MQTQTWLNAVEFLCWFSSKETRGQPRADMHAVADSDYKKTQLFHLVLCHSGFGVRETSSDQTVVRWVAQNERTSVVLLHWLWCPSGVWQYYRDIAFPLMWPFELPPVTGCTHWMPLPHRWTARQLRHWAAVAHSCVCVAAAARAPHLFTWSLLLIIINKYDASSHCCSWRWSTNLEEILSLINLK